MTRKLDTWRAAGIAIDNNGNLSVGAIQTW